MCDPKGEDVGKTGDDRAELDFGSEGETRKGGAKEEVRKRIKWSTGNEMPTLVKKAGKEVKMC